MVVGVAADTGKNRLLGRSSASSVCCWPDQLARCLPGVWHVTTKGLGRTGDRAALINPPNSSRSTSFEPLISRLSPLSLRLPRRRERPNAGRLPWRSVIWSARRAPCPRSVTAHQLFPPLPRGLSRTFLCTPQPVGGVFSCRLVAKVDAKGRTGNRWGGNFFFFGAVCVCAPTNNRVGVHVERRAAIRLGDSSGSGTVFHPPPLKTSKSS